MLGFCSCLEVADGVLQAAVVIQHHPSELQRLKMILVQQQGFLETLHGAVKITQLPTRIHTEYIYIYIM